jgi:hypothetical protein
LDPTSERSERRGIKLGVLPREGYKGKAPKFPIPAPVDCDGVTIGSVLYDRAVALWKTHWKSPQACAWSAEPWRHTIIAEMCMVEASVHSSPSSSAALIGQLHRFRDQLGLTPAGMRENGWTIGDVDEDKREAKREEARPSTSSRARMRLVSNG